MSTWDEGLTWFSRMTVAPVGLPMTTHHVSDQVLRVANDGADARFIDGAIAAATLCCERDTGRALVPQTWELVMSRFPLGANPIVIPRLPLISVESVSYLDEDGAEQSLAGSPAEYITIPSGEFRRARLMPLAGEVWPVTQYGREDAVTITFTCGYEDNEYPEVLLTGIGLMVGELYKRRSITTDTTGMPIPLSRFWRKVNG